MIRYEIDAAMMGDDWHDGPDGLRRFAATLQAMARQEGHDLDVAAITDAYNGARNDDPDAVSMDLWLRAREAYDAAVAP